MPTDQMSKVIQHLRSAMLVREGVDEGTRVVVPNERLAQTPFRTTPSPTRGCVWRCRSG